MNILSILAQKNVIDSSLIAAIEEEVASTGGSLEEILIRRGIGSDEILAAKGEYFSVPTRSLGESTVPYEVLKYIPEESALHYRFVPLQISEGVLEVGVVDPDNMEALDALNFISTKVNLPFKIYAITEGDFTRVLQMYKGLSGEVGRALGELETEFTAPAATPETVAEGPGVDLGKADTVRDGKIKEDAPVTKIVATILRYAVEGNASDIHIEPTHDELKVRFRVDGVLHTSLRLPPKVQAAVVARIKILASLKLDEKRKPQDGRFSATIEQRRIDFRVSTFPTYHGEKVVMRILDRGKERVSLADLGLSEGHLQTIKSALKRPYGMVVISGPTGSGKSTTLYAMLQEVDREGLNVVSLEDPVEYDVEGVAQSQVRPEIGYTFANGLRSILRQDPDIIMVGEIRDKETAQLAVQAALTGHLVLTTLHTNNAIGIIPRLVDMGVDQYLIAPTLVLGMAQRLVRTLCPEGGKVIPVQGSIQAMLDKQFADLPEAYRKGIPTAKEVRGIEASPECPNGTRGRTGVFEMFEMTKDLERIILKNPVEEAIYQNVRQSGMFTMKEDAIMKMLSHEIPFEEVNTLGGILVEEEESPAGASA
jgi:type IV pilus assembly protein PilB